MKRETIPRIGLGTYGIPYDSTADVVYEAIKKGYRHLDCAAFYGNERAIGVGLRKAFDEGLVKRDELWITSKIWNDAHEEKQLKKSVETTLKDLQIDYLDLLLMHWPLAVDVHGSIARIPISYTWAVMESLVDAGQVKHIGVSNFDIQLLHDLLSYCRIRPLTNQVECHVYLTQEPLLKYCSDEKIYLTAYAPLARAGGKIRQDLPQALADPVVLDVAKIHQKSPAQRSPYVLVIPKTASVRRLSENLESLNFDLTQQEMQKLTQLNRNM